MTDLEYPETPGQLPEVLPIFPLEGALLLPHGHLPLHIFEPRYREMIDAALGSRRLLGMIQPRVVYPHPTPDDAELFEIGCAGRIVSFAETDDGRYLITLRGVCRFRVRDELPLVFGFRRVHADYALFGHDLEHGSDDGVDRSRLLVTARNYLRLKAIECDWSAAESASANALVTTFAMMCPFEPQEKQALLECPDLPERARLLVSLFEMAMLGAEEPPAGIRH